MCFSDLFAAGCLMFNTEGVQIVHSKIQSFMKFLMVSERKTEVIA
jgi:hypothetical protein